MAIFARISARIGERFRESLERFSDLNDQTQEAFAGIRMLRSHALLDDETAAFSQRAAAAEAVDYRVQKLEAAFDPVVFISLSVATLLTLGVGSWRYLDDAITLGQLTSFSLSATLVRPKHWILCRLGNRHDFVLPLLLLLELCSFIKNDFVINQVRIHSVP